MCMFEQSQIKRCQEELEAGGCDLKVIGRGLAMSLDISSDVLIRLSSLEKKGEEEKEKNDPHAIPKWCITLILALVTALGTLSLVVVKMVVN